MSDEAAISRASGRAADAADAMLGNEALTEHLSDIQARILLDRILGAIDILDGQAATDEDFESGTKALRRFMRRVDAWIAEGAGQEGRETCLQAASGILRDPEALLDALISKPESQTVANDIQSPDPPVATPSPDSIPGENP